MLEAKEISKSYGSIVAVPKLSLKVQDRTSMCLLGRSGCGKSTLLKILGAIVRPDHGMIVFNGIEAPTLGETKIRKLVAYSFQEPLLLPYLDALENVLIGSRDKGLSNDRAKKLLSGLGLSERLYHKPAKLSVGEKKRIDIVRALLREPKILLADEPLSGLDPELGERVMRLMLAFCKSGGTLIYSAVEPRHSISADQVFRLDKV